jgi:DNA-binding MarR family transcriptional regulator
MPLSEEQQAVVARIAKRLASDAPETMRAGARAVLIQAIEHRAPMVRALRQALAGLPESNDLRVLGYRDLLADLLIAAEATLEPREQEADARLALESSPELVRALVALAGGPRTPGAIAQAIDVSVSSGTRYFQRLRALGLADAFSSRDGREVPHMLTPLGKRLAAECASQEAVSATRAVGVDDDEVQELKALGG